MKDILNGILLLILLMFLFLTFNPVRQNNDMQIVTPYCRTLCKHIYPIYGILLSALQRRVINNILQAALSFMVQTQSVLYVFAIHFYRYSFFKDLILQIGNFCFSILGFK